MIKEYENDTRQRTRLVQADERNEEYAKFQKQDDFKANTFLPISDQLHSANCENIEAKKTNDNFAAIIEHGTLKRNDSQLGPKFYKNLFHRFRRPDI